MKIKIILLLILFAGITKAQMSLTPSKHNLEKRISIEVKDQQISMVLQKISRTGNFYFSYSGTLIKQDSVVSLKMTNTPVKDILNKIFSNKVECTENGDYIILRYASKYFTIEPENITTAEKLYLISGYVIDTETGQRVKQASVYEKRLLQSTLTDEKGYFKLRFKGDHNEVMLTVSKDNYRDTTLIFLSDIKIKPEGYRDPQNHSGYAGYANIENSGIGKFFISSKQRIQSLNIPNFFANTPFQASFTPGLSTHGNMSNQIINKFSLNVLGGYTAGTDGVEVAGLFNINKGDVKDIQVAGLFNQVGGSVAGTQVSGLINDVRGETKGVQVAGILNNVKGTSDGVQVAGLVNKNNKTMNGIQVAGILNASQKQFDGVQTAGIANITSQSLNGVQISGIFNYARKIDGFQLALINVADTSSGYSLGLINIIKNGYHKISIYANETTNANISLKTGNDKLYTILFAGTNISNKQKINTAGLGIGHDFILNKRLAIGLEVTGEAIFHHDWDVDNLLNRVQSNLQFKLCKGLTIFGGPSLAIYSGKSRITSSEGSLNIIPSNHISFSQSTKGWCGFYAGITIM